MKIMVLCPHFRPDAAPTGEVMSAIVDGLVDRGHRLHVVTSLPWYTNHAVESSWTGRPIRTEQTPWGRISRIHPFPTDKRNIPARALAFCGFTGMATIRALMDRDRPDVVLAMSPPIFLGPAGALVARAKGVPFVFNIQDVFPDVAVELLLLTNERIIGIASWLERRTYLAADAVTVLSDELAANVSAKIEPVAPDLTRVRVIPNFVDTERVQVTPRDNAYRAEYGLEGKRVVMYAGNVGLSQSLDLMLAAASTTVDDRDLIYVINGGGAARLDLIERARSLPNVKFVDLQPRERLSEVLAAADLHVVPLRAGLARSSVPSKLYSILAAGRPVLASVDPGSEVEVILRESGAGSSVRPDDAEAFTKELLRMLDDVDGLREKGRAGRTFVETWVSPAAVAQKYEELFDELRRSADRSAAGGVRARRR